MGPDISPAGQILGIDLDSHPISLFLNLNLMKSEKLDLICCFSCFFPRV